MSSPVEVLPDPDVVDPSDPQTTDELCTEGSPVDEDGDPCEENA